MEKLFMMPGPQLRHFYITVAEEASSLMPAHRGAKLSSKRTGKDTYFWIINSIDETGGMLFAL